MPTLLNEMGFKFFFYANEHEPMHIHIMKENDFAKVELETLSVVHNYLKPKDLRLALKIAKKNKKDFIRTWHEWFDKS